MLLKSIFCSLSLSLLGGCIFFDDSLDDIYLSSEQSQTLESSFKVQPQQKSPLLFTANQFGAIYLKGASLDEIQQKYPKYLWNSRVVEFENKRVISYGDIKFIPEIIPAHRYKRMDITELLYEDVETAKKIGYLDAFNRKIDDFKEEYSPYKTVITHIDDFNQADYGCSSDDGMLKKYYVCKVKISVHVFYGQLKNN